MVLAGQWQPAQPLRTWHHLGHQLECSRRVSLTRGARLSPADPLCTASLQAACNFRARSYHHFAAACHCDRARALRRTPDRPAPVFNQAHRGSHCSTSSGSSTRGSSTMLGRRNRAQPLLPRLPPQFPPPPLPPSSASVYRCGAAADAHWWRCHGHNVDSSSLCASAVVGSPGAHQPMPGVRSAVAAHPQHAVPAAQVVQLHQQQLQQDAPPGAAIPQPAFSQLPIEAAQPGEGHSGACCRSLGGSWDCFFRRPCSAWLLMRLCQCRAAAR